MKKIFFTVLIIISIIFAGCTNPSTPNESAQQIKLTEKVEKIVDTTQTETVNILAQWRGPNRDGFYPDTNLLEYWPEGGPNLLWQYDSLGIGYASAAVTDDKIYTIATLEGISFIIALKHNGESLWKTKMGVEFTDNYGGSRGTPIICSDFGYVLDGMGVLYCFDSENGHIIWKKDILTEYKGQILGSGYCENLLVDDNRVFCTVGGEETAVVALNRKTGNLIWKSMGKGNGDKSAYASPIMIKRGDKKIFVNQLQKSLVGIDMANGDVLWTYPLESTVHSNTPVYKDGYIFAIENWDAYSVKLRLSEDGMNVTRVWKTSKMAAEQGDVVIIGNRIYGADVAAKTFNCVDWETGLLKYKIVRKNKPLRVATITADSLLYCYSSDGYFYLVKPMDKKFNTRGKISIPGNKKYHYSHPVIHKGRLYIRQESSLFVFDIKNK